MYTDQTGKFPVRSSRGKKYQVFDHHIESNCTLIETTKIRTEGELIAARHIILRRMKERSIDPKHQVLDNQISKAYKEEILATGMTFHMAMADDHRRNISEKSIQTWKDHFIGFMRGTTTTFPLHLCCQAIPQAERQLLLLRKSNLNPAISAYAYMYGTHDYNAKPFVPIGMETLVHNKPCRRKKFAEHFRKVHVLGTSFKHYRALIIWTKEIKTTRISGTVLHKHKYINNPDVAPEDRVVTALDKLSQEMKGNPPEHLSDTTLEQLTILGNILKLKN